MKASKLMDTARLSSFAFSLITFCALSVCATAQESQTSELLKALQMAGIKISRADSCRGGESAAYILDKRTIVICENPLNAKTLRHESWHVLQHCRMWKIDPSKTVTYFPLKKPLQDFVNGSGIDPFQVSKTYKQRGLDASARIIEIEAEAAAHSLSDRQIASMIAKTCI